MRNIIGKIALNLYCLGNTLTEQLVHQKIYQSSLVNELIDFTIIGDYQFPLLNKLHNAWFKLFIGYFNKDNNCNGITLQ